MAKTLIPSLTTIPDLDPEAAKELAEYLDSADFADICARLALEITPHSARRKGQIVEASVIKSELKQSILLHVSSVGAQDCSAIGDIIFGVVSQSIISHPAVQGDLISGKPELRALAVASSAAAGEASVRNTDLLKNLGSLKNVHAFEQQLREQIRSAHSSMKLPHAGTTRKVPYRQLFVDPLLSPVVLDSKDHVNNQVAVKEAIGSAPRAVILGNPGGGKSTLALKFTWDLARLSAKPGSPTVPLLVVLRDYSEVIQEGQQTIASYLEAVCRANYNIEPPPGGVEYLLLNGKAHVIFDGLDELIDISVRQQLVASVESFARRYPTVPILVTTREVGYEQAPLDEMMFQAFTLAPLGPAQVSEYARKWFALDDSVNKMNREDLARAFIADSEYVADLRTNPLMLSLMCGIYSSEHYIPANRPEVYRKCAELLFERWDKQRGIVSPLPFDAHVRFALNALALWMFANPKYDMGLKRSELVKFMTDYLHEKRFSDEADAENAAIQFIEFCTGRAWVLTDVGSDRQQELYGFTHRTFLEFFAANQLVRLNSSADALFASLLPKIENEQWDMVAQLALQLLGNNVEDGSDDFLTRLLDAYYQFVSAKDTAREGRKFSTDTNIISFAARSLAFVVPRPSVVSSTVSAVIEHDRISVMDERRSVQAAWSGLMSCASENRAMVSKAVREYFEAKSHFDEIDLKCIVFLGELDLRIPTSLSREETLYWRALQKSLFEDFQPEFERAATRHAWVDVLRATAGRMDIANVISTRGYGGLIAYRVASRAGRAPLLYRWLTADYDTWRDGYIEECIKSAVPALLNSKVPWLNSDEDDARMMADACRNSKATGGIRAWNEEFGAFTATLILPVAEDILARFGEREAFNGRLSHMKRGSILHQLMHARLGRSPARRSVLDFLGSRNADSQVTDLVTQWCDGGISLASPLAPLPRRRS
ncbi:hypothetical protein FB565_002905 [Actinoplanes lutulentus]|uniref:NACHT domain-containing protein n=1 Tax=Actinoplanes lutulentus TaxID=1287878 RepID=UPI0015EC4981|nr:NACHT domain-containing protein [Actinoplanes lutulentus]MBB2943192.1 hypothetical protein [Actinoplanes lutulentus]